MCELCQSAGIDTVAHMIEKLLGRRERVLVAIDGNSGAGKSTLGAALAGRFDANLLHMDEFFLSAERKTPQRLSEPGGNVDYERFKSEVLDPLLTGMPFCYRPFDCQTGAMGMPVAVARKDLSIIEGSYSLHPTLAHAYDLKVFCSIEPEPQRRRILERNGAGMLERFEREWIPLENAYFDAFSIPAQCDIVLRTDGHS